MKYTKVYIGLLFFIMVVLFLGTTVKEGATNPPPKYLILPENSSIADWNLTNLKDTNKFKISELSDEYKTKFVLFCLNKGNLAYAKSDFSTSEMDWKPIGCFGDDGSRRLYFKDPNKNPRRGQFEYVNPNPSTGDRKRDEEITINRCKEKAEKYGAPLFAIQAGGACFVGDSREDATKESKTCGLLGGYWSQTVFSKQPASKTKFLMDATAVESLLSYYPDYPNLKTLLDVYKSWEQQ
jgi:hypothetical protein